MTEDLISLAAALGAISCNITIKGRQNAEIVAATIGAFADRIKALPSAHPEEVTTVFGYPVRHLAAIAKALEDENITPENVANLVSRMEYIAEKMIGELNRLGEKWVALFGEEEEE